MSGGRKESGDDQRVTRTMRAFAMLLSTAVAALIALPAGASTQHLVGEGRSWSELIDRVRPGDEIILLPGLHKDVAFDNLRGTREKPITIRGISTEQPSIIEARREGIRLRAPQHIIIRDLAITGATVAGITIAHEKFSRDVTRIMPPGEPDESLDIETPWPAHVTIRNVTIAKTGPRGRRNGIHLEGVRHVNIERVRIEGWGGSAVEVVASNDIRIEHCFLRGRDDHGQLNGVQVRGSSERVRIAWCYFTRAGEAGVVLGAPQRLSDPGMHNNAVRVTFERNVIRHSQSAIAFLDADRCIVRNNTIVEPARFAYVIAPPGSVKQTTFSANLVVWKPGGLESLSLVVPPAKGSGLRVEQNLWWSGEAPEQLAELGAPDGDVRADQKMDIDPDLDEQFKPRQRLAQMFGTEGP